MKLITFLFLLPTIYAQTLCNCICPATSTISSTTTSIITTTSTTHTIIPTPTNSFWKPENKKSWYIQYTGTIDFNKNVNVYNIDLEGTSISEIQKLHDRGVKVVCYFSAGTFENYRDDISLFSSNDYGNIVDGWPDENWLDTRSANVRNIMKKRMLLAKTKNCDAVDPDNMDGFDNNSGFPLTYQTQLDYNKFIANFAHSIGLSVSLKNDLAQVKDLVNYFDFAVNEECVQWNECDLLNPFVKQNKSVFHIEYKGTCKNISGFSSILKKLNLGSYQVNC